MLSLRKLVKPLFLTTGFLYLQTLQETKPKTCGIVGYLGTKNNALTTLQYGIEVVMNRGYDSAGIATIDPDTQDLVITKNASSSASQADCIDLLKQKIPKKHKPSYLGIGHTRWATHGAKDDLNAHPHTDSKRRVALIHNGTLTNFTELRKQLISEGVELKTGTDTELIAQMVGQSLDQNLSLYESTRKALERCEGTWGIAVISKTEPDSLVVSRRGSPIIIGTSEDGDHFVGSEVSVFTKFTRNYIDLDNNEIVLLKRGVVNHFERKRIKLAVYEEIYPKPQEPYKYWFHKEINEIPRAILQALNFGARIENDIVKLGGLEKQIEYLKEIKNLVIIGCGTSLYAAQLGTFFFKKFKCMNTVQAVNASEISENDFPSQNSGVIVISQSGETHDVRVAVELAHKKLLPVMGVVNVIDSQIARMTTCGVYMNAGREVAVPSTKSYFTSCVVLGLIAAWFFQTKQATLPKAMELVKTEFLRDLRHLSENTQALLSEEYWERCKQISLALSPHQSIFVLGAGTAFTAAREGALKLKETAYIHAEAYPGGELKHGPFALISVGMPVILIILEDHNKKHMINTLLELNARDAYCIVITNEQIRRNKTVPIRRLENLEQQINNTASQDQRTQNKIPKHKAPQIIHIPDCGIFTSMLAVQLIDMIAFHLSVKKGINPDLPRNLAKVVTVD